MTARFTATAVRSSSTEGLAAIRLRVAHLLNTTSLDSAWFPPAATLIVRKLADPLPRQLYNEPGAIVASAEWERAAQSALREQFLRAIRPARQVVTANTNAVLFDSPAELLACFARDLCTGDASVRWWWKGYARNRGRTLGAALAEAFRRDPRSMPAAIAKLAEWGEAERPISQLSEEQAKILIEEVLQIYNLPRLAAMVRSRSQTVGCQDIPQSKSIAADSLSSGNYQTSETSAPWEPFVASIPEHARLGATQQAFLGVALLLARAPQHARTKHFETQFKRWFARATQPVADLPPREWLTSDPVFENQRNAASSQATHAAELSPAAGRPITRAGEKPAPTIIFQSSRLAPKPSQTHEAPQQSTRGDFPLEIVETPSIEADFHSGASTQLGGLLFLIPFFRALNFFSYLESDFALEFPPRPWALVELFGRCLLDHMPAPLQNDPVWTVLRALDGREQSEPLCPDVLNVFEYRLPLAWVERCCSKTKEPLTFSRRGQRLLLWHPLGFPLMDTTAPELSASSFSLETLRQLAGPKLSACGFTTPKKAIRRALSGNSVALPEEFRSRPDLCGFLHFFCPFFRWALLDSISRGSQKNSDSLHRMLCRPGHLYVTETHVDLVMDLASASLDVRIAGLDANPGWVPELARVITFHYRA